MKIQLLQTKLGSRAMKNGRDMMVFPLGIAAVATFVRQHNPEADIEVIDGDFEDLEARLDGDMIGIQPNILNVDAGLMKRLHDRGQKVILGGVHASQAWQDFIRLPYVDYVAVGDGEIPILKLTKGKDPDAVEGLASATKPGKLQRVPIDELPAVDRSLYDQERYMQNSSVFIETYMPGRPFRRMTNVYSNKGCRWRAKTGGCYFCGRLYGELQTRKPEDVWAEVSALVRDYDADFIWDVSDSFTSDRQWIREMTEKRPEGIRPYWYVYARVSELTEEMLSNLAKINVYQILVGIETGDDGIARDITKGNRNSRTLSVAATAKEYGIRLLPSFIVGLPGESEDSLEKTYQIAARVVAANGCEELSVSMLIPLPGSRAYEDIKQEHLARTGQELPLVTDGEQLQRLWFQYKCRTGFDTGVEYMFRLLSLTPLKSTFGSPYMGIDPRMPGWNQLNSTARHKLFNA